MTEQQEINLVNLIAKRCVKIKEQTLGEVYVITEFSKLLEDIHNYYNKN